MAQILVRKLEENVKRRLRSRAKANGRSMEEEVRIIIRHAVSAEMPPEGLGTRLAKAFAGKVPKGFKIEEMRGKVRIPDFSK